MQRVKAPAEPSKYGTWTLELVLWSGLAPHLVNWLTWLPQYALIGATPAVASLILLIAALGTAVAHHSRTGRPRRKSSTLTFLVVFWAWGFGLAVAQGNRISFTMFLVPLACLVVRIVAVTESEVILAGQRVISLMFVLLVVSYVMKNQAPAQISLQTSATYQNQIWNLLGTSDRFRGVFAHPNTLGMFCAFSACWAVQTSGRMRNFGMVLVLVVLALSSSRTGLIAAGAMYATFYLGLGQPAKSVARLWQRLRRYVLGFGLLLGLLITARILYADNRTLTGRTKVWTITSIEWQQNPWLGLGAGRDLSTSAENQILTTLWLVGLVGLVIQILFLVSWGRQALGRRKGRKGLSALVLVVTLVEFVTERPMIWNRWTMPLMFILIGVAAVGRQCPCSAARLDSCTCGLAAADERDRRVPQYQLR